MRCLGFCIIAAAAFGNVAHAGDIARNISSGTILVDVELPARSADAAAARSVSFRVVGTGATVLCLPLENGQRGSAETDPIQNTGEPTFIDARSHTGSDCSGEFSTTSADRYSVVWLSPDRPTLHPVQ